MTTRIIAIPVCPKHPRYEGKRPTDRDCDKCQLVYLNRAVQTLQIRVEHLIERDRERSRVYY